MTGSSVPTWFWDLLGVDPLADEETAVVDGQELVVDGVVVRQTALVSEAQAQTSDSFGFKWEKRDTFDSPASLRRMREWLTERYGDIEKADWWDDYGADPVVLDAGCGAAMSALELFGKRFEQMRYVGADISAAVDVAAARVRERGYDGAFLQADLLQLPLPPQSVDVIFSEGVLHHTDSTRTALLEVAKRLAPGGRFLFYVYRRKGPIREFTDDYVRELLQDMTPEEAWDALVPLTELGKALGELDVEVEVPEDVDLLGIPAGRIPVQRLFYWHVVKAFHHSDLSLEEMNHINYDWFAPRNAHRQSPEEVRSWCDEAGLNIEREVVEDAGITVVARRGGG